VLLAKNNFSQLFLARDNLTEYGKEKAEKPTR
jgi:hypothetical protein